MGEPTGAFQSTPLWRRTVLRIGCLRGPKVEVSTPLTGVTMPPPAAATPAASPVQLKLPSGWRNT